MISIVLLSLILTVCCIDTCSAEQLDPKGKNCLECASNKYCCINYKGSGTNQCTDKGSYPEGQCSPLCEIPNATFPTCSLHQMQSHCSSCVTAGSVKSKYCCIPWDGKPSVCSDTQQSITKCQYQCINTKPVRIPRSITIMNILDEPERDVFFAYNGESNTTGPVVGGRLLHFFDEVTIKVPGDTQNLVIFPIDMDTCKPDDPKNMLGAWTCTTYLHGTKITGHCTHPWECNGVAGAFSTFVEFNFGYNFLKPDDYSVSAVHGFSRVGIWVYPLDDYAKVPGVNSAQNCGSPKCDVYEVSAEYCPRELRLTNKPPKGDNDVDICMSLPHSFALHKQAFTNPGLNELISMCKNGDMGECTDLTGYGTVYDTWTNYVQCSCPNSVTCNWEDSWSEEKKYCKVAEMLAFCKTGFGCSPISPPATLPEYQKAPYNLQVGKGPVCSNTKPTPARFCKDNDPQGFEQCRKPTGVDKVTYPTIFQNLCYDAKSWQYDGRKDVNYQCYGKSYKVEWMGVLKSKEGGQVVDEQQQQISGGERLGWLVFVLMVVAFCLF